MVLRRMSRFLEVGGLCEAYEHRGDDLIQFHDIANLLADMVQPAVNRDAVIRRFLFSARTGLFGRHGPRQTVEQLIDLDDFSAPRGRYSLRPSYIRVEASPERMRAPRSVWARWIKALGWSVPPELELGLEPSGSVAKGAVSDDRDPIEALIAFVQRHRLWPQYYALGQSLDPRQSPADLVVRRNHRIP